MESKNLHGFPLSTAQMTPKTAPSTTSGIRAPLTIDESDFEYSVSSSKSRRNSTTSSYYYSGSELESEGFASGEDEFESASERPYVTDPDEEVVEETHFVKKFSFSRPLVRNPNGNSVEERSNGSEIGVSRPYAKSPDGEFGSDVGKNAIFRPFKKSMSGNFVEERSNGSEFGVSRPYVKSPDGEFGRVSGDVGGNTIFRPFMRNLSGNLVRRESRYSSDLGLSRPYVKSPDEGFLKLSGSVSGNANFRPFARNKDERIYKEISSIEDSDDSGDDFIVDQDYILKRNNSRPIVAVMDEEVSENEQIMPVMDAKVSLVQKLNIPIAQITGDSDDDSQGSEISEDSGFSGIARIPSIEVLHRVNSAPKVRISDVDDEVDDSELQGENIVEMEFTEDFGGSNGLKDEKDHLSTDMMQDKGRDEYSSALEIQEKGQMVNFNDTIQEIVVINNGRKSEDLVNHVGPVDFSEGTVSENISHVDSYEELGCPPESVKLMESEVIELGSSSDFQDIESEKVENGSGQKIDETVELFNSTVFSESESVDQRIDIKEVKEMLNDGCHQLSELSEAVIENELIDMARSLLKDADSACQYVLQGTTLESEAINEVEKSDQLSEVGKTMKTEPILDLSSTSLLHEEILKDHVEEIDGEIVRDLDEGGIRDCGQIIDIDGDSGKLATSDDIGNFFLERDSADVGVTSPLMPSCALNDALTEGELTLVKKIQHISVRYLRLLHRLGRSPEDSLAAKVLAELTVAKARYSSQASDLNSAKMAAIEDKDLDFSLSILVIGKTGVGKSATINSLFGETRTVTNAFEPATKKVKEIIGTINGIKVKIFDTPGLRSSIIDQSVNHKILSSIKKVMKISPPHTILYVDRLDTQIGSIDDLHVLKMVTSCLGSSIWRKSIVVLTHATSWPHGYPSSDEIFDAQHSQDAQLLISHSSVELVMGDPCSMIPPVSLVENHPFDKSGESWRSEMMFLCYSIKTISEVNSVVTIDNLSSQKRPFGLEGILVRKNESSETILATLPEIMVPPTSLNGENPSFRFRLPEPSVRRPIFYSNGWAHDTGYEAIEDKIAISGRIPIVFSTNDKEEFDVHLQSSVWRSDKTSMGLSVMKYRDDVIWGCNLKSELAVGRKSRLSIGVGLNDKQSGRICVKIRCSDQLQIAALSFIPIAKAIFKKVLPQSSNEDHLV